MSAIFWCLFEETPRPPPLPSFPFPNHHPFGVRWREEPMPLVPVAEGPLTTYSYHIQIPVPGEPGGPPLWNLGSPSQDSTPPDPAIPTDPDSFSPHPVNPEEPVSFSPAPQSSPCMAPLSKPSKTYLRRRTEKLQPVLISTSGPGGKAVHLPDTPTLPPARRRKGEKRCGRFVCISKIYFHCSYPVLQFCRQQ